MTKVISLRRKHYAKTPKQHKDNNNIKFNNFNEEKYKIIFLLLSIGGLFLGAICFRLTNNTNFSEIITTYFHILNSGNFESVVTHLLKFDCIFLFISFFIGTSFIGSTLSFISPMIKCIYIGFLSSYLYTEYELKGVFFCLLLLYPCFTITTTSLIFASNENVYMSQYIFKCLCGKNSTDNISIRLFMLRYFLLFVINVVCIVITALVISFIGPKLNII